MEYHAWLFLRDCHGCDPFSAASIFRSRKIGDLSICIEPPILMQKRQQFLAMSFEPQSHFHHNEL